MPTLLRHIVTGFGVASVPYARNIVAALVGMWLCYMSNDVYGDLFVFINNSLERHTPLTAVPVLLRAVVLLVAELLVIALVCVPLWWLINTYVKTHAGKLEPILLDKVFFYGFSAALFTLPVLLATVLSGDAALTIILTIGLASPAIILVHYIFFWKIHTKKLPSLPEIDSPNPATFLLFRSIKLSLILAGIMLIATFIMFVIIMLADSMLVTESP